MYESEKLHSIKNIEKTLAYRLSIYGIVQGVGMRPYLYQLALHHQLTGWVKNVGNDVEVLIQGEANNIEPFLRKIYPPNLSLAIISKVEKKNTDVDKKITLFSLLKSDDKNNKNTAHLIKDYAICKQCKSELLDKNNRRYFYPFISCTNCGPRYSIFKKYPLDRRNFSLNEFSPCEKCNQEYLNVNNRRFHTQNICCHQCGPLLFTEKYKPTEKDTYIILSQAAKRIEQGSIIALKSSSGYKLICDATNADAINLLRMRKKRPHKPFAVMFPNISSMKSTVNVTREDIQLIESKENPLLLVDKKPNTLPDCINPKLSQIATCLPGSAIEVLLLSFLNRPVIFTSGNISGQPIISDPTQAEQQLISIADNFIHHNLKITHAIDDSVWKKIMGVPRPIRLGKGYAPLEFNLPFTLKNPVIALGAYMKNTIAIGVGNRAIISPHVGDTSDYGTWMFALQQVDILKQHFAIESFHYLIDSHQGYTSHQWVKKNKLPHTSVLHHYAHASAVAASIPDNTQCLVFTWDGTGAGNNNELWGGETLLGSPGNWSRVASVKQFVLPGADAAIKKPWYIAMSLLWHTETKIKPDFIYNQDSDEFKLLRKIWEKKINSPMTSSIGRLFDAAASLLGLLTHCSYDGQAAMILEKNANSNTKNFISIPFIKNEKGLFIADWKGIIVFLTKCEFSVSYRAMVFHNSLAQLILSQSLLFRRLNNINHIGLSGGVFQNSILVELTISLLKKHNFDCYIGESLPSNDAHISYGQIIEHGYKQQKSVSEKML